MSKPQLSIIFPAYNEGARIQDTLAKAIQFIDERALPPAEIVVVNDGSKDCTLEAAEEYAGREPRVRVVSHTPNHGKGYAVKRGMLEAQGDFRVFLDVDLATPLGTIGPALAALQGGADVVIGSRHLPGSTIEVPQNLIRRSMGTVFRRLANVLLPLQVSDVTCGFKGMTAQAAASVFAVQREEGWAFDAELIYVARKWGLTIREIPVTWRDSGDTRVRPVAAAINSFEELLRIRAHDRRGAYARPAPSTGP